MMADFERFVKGGILCAALLASACGYKPPVIGAEEVLVIIVSDEDRPLLEPLLRDVFGRTMATPSPEPYFKILVASPLKFESYQHYKSLIVASLANPPDSTGDLLARKILGEERTAAAKAGGNPIFLATDYLASGQMFMGLQALDAIHAQTELERLREWLFEQFESQLRVRQSKVIFKRHESKELADSLAGAFGWKMRLEKDYIVVKEKADSGFVWLGRGYPYRWLSVHWIDDGNGLDINQAWAWERMDHIATQLFVDITIDTLLRSTELGMENEHSILIMRGVWSHNEQVAGGPFVNYLFRDREQGRIYMVSGFVFHPGGSKTLLIKKLEIMMRTFHTFRTRPETQYSSERNLT